jgi:hypothetical protein
MVSAKIRTPSVDQVCTHTGGNEWRATALVRTSRTISARCDIISCMIKRHMFESQDLFIECKIASSVRSPGWLNRLFRLLVPPVLKPLVQEYQHSLGMSN